MIKIDEITEIEIKDGTLTINQFDNNNVILSQDNLKKILAAINYTRCSLQLKGKYPTDFLDWLEANTEEVNKAETLFVYKKNNWSIDKLFYKYEKRIKPLIV
jgi:hypothetical protein